MICLKFNPCDYDYTYSEWEQIIHECVLSERNRKIMQRKLLDDITFEKLAEEMEMSVRGVQYVVKKGLDKIIKHI